MLSKLFSLSRAGQLDEVEHPNAYVAKMISNRAADLYRQLRSRARAEQRLAAREATEATTSEDDFDIAKVDPTRARAAVREWTEDLLDGAMASKPKALAERSRVTLGEVLELAFDNVTTEALALRQGLTPEASAADRKRIVNAVHQRHHRLREVLKGEVERRLEAGSIDAATHEAWLAGLEALRRCQNGPSSDVGAEEDGVR
ncbi:MAG: hypothetical protein H6724_10195 [Sandaracinus sp.]|nr:hypothetical protein [Sandaracinus sp.]